MHALTNLKRMTDMKFFDRLRRLEELAASSNPSSSLDEVTELLTDPLLFRHFFEHLANEQWLDTLRSAGFFSAPPKVTREDGVMRFPAWPQATYLVRMAKDKIPAETIADIIAHAAPTDNPTIMEDLLDAILCMPANVSVSLIDLCKQWAHTKYNAQFLSTKLASLVVTLAKGGQDDAAKALLREVIGIKCIEVEKEAIATARIYTRKEPQSQCELWVYKDIMKKQVPEIVSLLGAPILPVLCDVLQSIMDVYRAGNETTAPADASYALRPAVEDHEQNSEDLLGIVVKSVRDTATCLVRSNKMYLSKVVYLLDSRPYRIFHRIALHLLREQCSSYRELVWSHVSDSTLMYDIEVRHEYLHLLTRVFGDLSAERQLHLLKMIDQYRIPDLVESDSDDKDSRTDKHAKYARYMKLRFLTLVGNHLPREWKERHEELLAEFGEPEHPDFDMYVTSWTGPISPLNEDQIEKMSEDELIKYLESWDPSGDSFESSLDGLSGVLSSVVAKEPKRFAAIVWKLKNLPLMYIREFLRGFESALRNGNVFPWDDFIDFCVWIAEQPRDTPTAVRRTGDDHDWGLTRRYLASLLSNAFVEGPAMLPLSCREKVWKMLDVLTEDPDPTPEHEAAYGGQNMDPPTLCINTTRGEALHCLIRYALWVYKHEAKDKSASDGTGDNFESMPKVREKLERHLNTAHDPSLAIRSAYGRFFPWLVRVAPAWAAQNASTIFPSEETAKSYWETAWGTYVVFCQPYSKVLDVLSECYRVAIRRIGTDWTTKAHLKNPEESLADHIVTFYWLGILSLTESDGLMDLFWCKASDELKYSALHHVGWILTQDRVIEVEILGRMKALWEYRLLCHNDDCDLTPKLKELSAFALWFVSPHFDREWKISNLSQALRYAAKPMNSHDLMAELRSYTREFPQKVMLCVEYLVGQTKESWELGCDEQDLMEVLNALLVCQDKSIRLRAENIVHHMGSIGRFEFRKLLSLIGSD